MQGILGLEQHVPDAIEAGIVTEEIADKCDIDEYQQHQKIIRVLDGLGHFPAGAEGHESPYIAVRIEQHQRYECQDHRGGQKDGTEYQPVDSLVLGGGNNHSLAVHAHVGTLAQKFIGQVIRPFREQILRAGSSAPDSTYRHVGDDGDNCDYDCQPGYEKEIRPPDLTAEHIETGRGQVNPKYPKGRNQRNDKEGGNWDSTSGQMIFCRRHAVILTVYIQLNEKAGYVIDSYS